MFVSSTNPECKYPNTKNLPNNSKNLKDIFIIVKAVGGKIYTGQDNLVYYREKSF